NNAYSFHESRRCLLTQCIKELASLAIQHRILSRVPEKIGHLATGLINWAVQTIIQPDSDWMQEETGPAPWIIVCSCTGRHIGIDQGCRVHHTVNTGWSRIVPICIGRHLLLAISSTPDSGGQKENPQGKSRSSHW